MEDRSRLAEEEDEDATVPAKLWSEIHDVQRVEGEAGSAQQLHSCSSEERG